MAHDRYAELGNLKIFDCHGHFGPCRSFHMADDGSVESMIEVMDACGIERVVFSSMRSIYYDISSGNREMIESVERYPDRLLGYICVHPDSGEQSQIDELELYGGRTGIGGVKIHPGLHETRPNVPGYEPVYRWCLEHDYPVLSHTWGEGDITDFARILERMPKLKVIIGHSGGPDRKALELACNLAKRYEHVFLDITCSQTLAGLIEWMCERVGHEKVFFGSDIPFIDPRPAIGLVAFARISDAAKEAIFYDNSARLFDAS